MPDRSWTFAEPCCGSGAVTLHLLGAKRSLMPYQGSKWRYRREIEALIRRTAKVEGPPSGVVLHDVGPWGRVLPLLINHEQRSLVLDSLTRLMDTPDVREVYDHILTKPAPTNPSRYAAEFLFLQRLSFSGKAVGERGGSWVSPGFNKTSAYGTPATEKFGAVRPMLHSLVETLESYDRDLRDVEVLPPARHTDVVYIDPPYVGTTPYPNGTLSRNEVATLARHHAHYGSAVFVSEAEPIVELQERSWEVTMLSNGRHGTSPFKTTAAEWITFRCSKRRV